jgi:hypothetical protein
MQVSSRCQLLFPTLALCGLLIAGCGKPETAPESIEGFSFQEPRQAWSRLDAESRAKIDSGLGKRGRPVLTIIHSTGSTNASPSSLEDNHRRVRGLADGLAYHFVIGNGRGLGDGDIFVTRRWREGIPSQALQDPRQETDAIAIALVGEFNRREPTRAQLEALDELLDYLTAKIGPHPVRLHAEVERSARGCPGKNFPVTALRAAYSK